MLCRAGSGHRNFVLLPFQVSARCFVHAPPKRAALPLKRAEGQISRPKSRPGFTGKISRSLLSKFTFEIAKFLTIIEDMSSKTMDRDQILLRFQDTPPNLLGGFQSIYALSQEMIIKSCPERVVHILHISHILGTALAHNQYEQIIYQLASRRCWEQVCIVAAMAEKYTGRWTVRLLNWATRSLVETQQYTRLDGVLDLFERDGLKPTRRTYHLLVRGHLRNSDLIRARGCLLTMQNAGFKIEKSTYVTVLGAYRALGPNEAVEEQAFQTFQGGHASDAAILNGLMQLCIDDGNIRGALQVSELFSLLPLRNSNNGEKDGDDAGRTTPWQKTATTLPDNATFNILLAFLARKRDSLPQVLRVFSQISVAGLRVDDKAVAALICAHFTANMSGVAVAIVAEMCTTHCPGVEAEEFEGLGRAGSVGFDMLQARSISPTTHIFNVLLEGLLPAYGFLGLQRVLRIMGQAAVAPDSSTAQIIVSYLYDLQDTRPTNLIRVLRTLAKFPTASLTIQHTNTIFRALLHREWAIIRTKSWNATAQRVRFSHRSRFSIDQLSKPAKTFDPTAGIALTSFNRSIAKLLEPVIRSLLDTGVMSNGMTFALSIRRHALVRMDMHSARRIFDVMVTRGIRPNAYHFSALLEGYVVQGNMQGAKEILNQAARSGISLNVVMHTILIIGYGMLRRPDLALRAFDDMRSTGVHPDFVAIEAVVSTYWFAREYRSARNLLLELWPLVADFPEELADAPLRVLIQSFRALRPRPSVLRTTDSPPERPRRSHAERGVARAFIKLIESHLLETTSDPSVG